MDLQSLGFARGDVVFGQTSIGVRVSARLETIIENWLTALRKEGGPGASSNQAILTHQVPQLLLALSQDLDECDLEATESGAWNSVAESALELARAHGDQRGELEGFTVRHMLREYQLLRRATLNELWETGEARPRDIERVIAFFDEVIHEASKVFAQKSENDLLRARHELERSLERAKAHKTRYETAVKASGDVIWEWDLKSDRVELNDAISSTFGHSREQIRSGPRWWTDHIHPSQVVEITASLAEFLRGGQPVWRREFQFRRGDGTYADVCTSAVLIRDAQGLAKFMMGVMQDITGRKKDEEVLRLSNRALEEDVNERNSFLSAVLDRLDDGICACDASGVITLLNRSCREMHGFGPNEEFGSVIETAASPALWRARVRVLDAVTGLEISAHDSPMGRALNGQSVRGAGLITETIGGSRRYLDCDAQPLVSASGKKLGAVCILHDRTRERESAAKAESLERTNVELANFATVAAHDLKSPLNSITQFVDLLSEEYRGKMGEDADQILDFIGTAGRRMGRMVDSLLLYARSGANIKKIANVSSQSVVEAAVANLKTLIETTGARARIDSLPVVSADPDRLLQVFQNVLQNAIKYHREEVAPEIRISAREATFDDENRWMFCVSDNGVGIREEDRKRVFGLFERLDPKTNVEGSGVGMAVCKRIVEAHGGRIWIESTLGFGSQVYFTLPKEPSIEGSTQ